MKKNISDNEDFTIDIILVSTQEEGIPRTAILLCEDASRELGMNK